MEWEMDIAGDYTIKYEVPSTPEAIDAVGGPGTSHTNAIDNLSYRSYAPMVRKKVVAKIEEKGYKAKVIKTVTLDNGKTRDVFETETTSIKNAVKEGVVTKEEVQAILNEITKANSFDDCIRGLTRGPAKVAKSDLRDAERLAARVDAGETTWEVLIANLSTRAPGWTPDFEEGTDIPTVESIARGIKIMTDEIKRSTIADQLVNV